MISVWSSATSRLMLVQQLITYLTQTLGRCRCCIIRCVRHLLHYLAPGLHVPFCTRLQVTAHTQWRRKAGQELAVKRPQTPMVVLAVHALDLTDLEASTAVSGALNGEQKQRQNLSPWHEGSIPHRCASSRLLGWTGHD